MECEISNDGILPYFNNGRTIRLRKYYSKGNVKFTSVEYKVSKEWFKLTNFYTPLTEKEKILIKYLISHMKITEIVIESSIFSELDCLFLQKLFQEHLPQFVYFTVKDENFESLFSLRVDTKISFSNKNMLYKLVQSTETKELIPFKMKYLNGLKIQTLCTKSYKIFSSLSKRHSISNFSSSLVALRLFNTVSKTLVQVLISLLDGNILPFLELFQLDFYKETFSFACISILIQLIYKLNQNILCIIRLKVASSVSTTKHIQV
eukprot:snap_masked-scaffold_88-processed-gene-0.31-mRNA-1 protein AED:1.00 eAED:1.00 QI:0/0/0/0/1/1/2/0/262